VIGQWFWELEVAPSWYGDAYQYVDELWAPTKFIEEMLRNEAPDRIPVRHMPLPLRQPRVVENATRRDLDATLSMLGPDDLRRETWPSLFSLGTSTITDSPGAYITSLRTTMRATRDAVTVTTPESVTLSSRTGAIRIQVRNDSDQDLTVRVRLTSAKLTLTDPTRIVVLTRGGTTELNVSATTRASGEIPISIWVSTPEGNQSVVDPITISANVNAIAAYGQFVSAILLLLLFAWWWSNRRSARRERLNATTV
jgi:hypothetical protein